MAFLKLSIFTFTSSLLLVSSNSSLQAQQSEGQIGSDDDILTVVMMTL